MEQLADQGDGFYAYVDGEQEAVRLFTHDLTGTLQTIAREAKVQVEFNPAAVSTYRLIGFENRAVADDDFRDDTVDGGEIGAGHTVTALYEVVAARGSDVDRCVAGEGRHPLARPRHERAERTERDPVRRRPGGQHR